VFCSDCHLNWKFWEECFEICCLCNVVFPLVTVMWETCIDFVGNFFKIPPKHMMSNEQLAQKGSPERITIWPSLSLNLISFTSETIVWAAHIYMATFIFTDSIIVCWSLHGGVKQSKYDIKTIFSVSEYTVHLDLYSSKYM